MAVVSTTGPTVRCTCACFWLFLHCLPCSFQHREGAEIDLHSDLKILGGLGVPMVRPCWGADGAEKENKLVVLGEKGRAQLSRDQKDTILETIADLGKSRYTFSQVRIGILGTYD